MSFKTTTPILSEVDTLKFIKQIDLACRLLDEDSLKAVIYKFDLEHLEDSPEFLEDTKEKFRLSQDTNTDPLIEKIEGFTTRCIVCVYGKKVRGFRIHFSVEGAGGSRIHCTREIAINFELRDGRLTDFGWCNAFLNKQDLEDLDNECPF